MKKTDFFGNEKVNFDKLLEFGFYLKKYVYYYTKIIVNNQFRLDVIITSDGKIDTKLTDAKT
ncbi:hypothetical protein [Spiroplasma endosymbiont of Labia minor]|uniref:hypothetical protein n=1 Tax=Spiroplasma endosymbiont of Labia minor TaxID=3066305 RepID=UPI0030D165DD